jgi:hypothetical protein
VLSIDGHSTASMLPYEATALLRPAGAVRRLALRRGTSTITVSLQLAPIM